MEMHTMGRPDLTRVSPCSQRGSVRKLPSRALLPLGLALLVVQGCGGDSSSKSSAKEISSFAFEASKNSGLTADAAGTITDTSIAVTLPSGTAVTSLTPTIAVSADASVSPASGEAKDFTSPVTYTVTAQDGSTKVFTVTVTVAASSSAKDITQFTILDVNGTISDTSIAVIVPGGTVLTSLTPTIAVSAGASVSPATGAAQDFTNPVTYTVTAADSSQKTYTVTVTTADAKDITQFTISSVDGVIGGSHIAVSLPSGALTSLTPTIVVSAGASVSPENGVAQDFSSPVTYTVTAADSSTKTYTVTVTVGATNKNMTLFSILGVDACESGCAGTLDRGSGSGSGTIMLALPSGTDLTNLTPTIALTSGATVDPASGVARDFTSQVTYVVTNSAASGTPTKNWNVTVTAP